MVRALAPIRSKTGSGLTRTNALLKPVNAAVTMRWAGFHHRSSPFAAPGTRGSLTPVNPVMPGSRVM